MELYRYVDYRDETDIVVELLNFTVVKETPCGYWINVHTKKRKQKWVAKEGKKRFAYFTKKLALENFIARKKRQIRILQFNLSNAREALLSVKQLNKTQYGRV
jgi:hypothetical protein